MPIQRRPLQDLQAQATVTPTATPVSTYSRPNQSTPNLPTITDLSPLSETIQRWAIREEQKRGKRAEVAAERLFADPTQTELIRDLTSRRPGETDEQLQARQRKEFQRLAEEGHVPEMAMPQAQIRFAELAGQQVVNDYRRRVLARVESAAAVSDPQTGLPANPDQTPDEILAEEWAPFADSPAVTDFYGAKVSAPGKLAVDEEFRAAVARVRGEEMSRETRTRQVESAAQDLDAAIRGDLTVDEVSAKLNSEMGTNFVKPRELAMRAVELAATRMAHGTPDAPGDPDEALDFLDRVAPAVKVGGLRLDQDDATALAIEELKDRLQLEAGAADQRKAQALRSKAALVSEQVRRDSLAKLIDAREAGESLAAVELALSEGYQDLPDEDRGIALQTLREIRRSVESDHSTDPAAERGVRLLMVEGQWASARQAVRSGLDAGSIEALDAQRLLDEVDQRQREDGPVRKDPSYSEGLAVLERGRSQLSEMDGELGRSASRAFEDALVEFQTTAPTLVSEDGTPDRAAIRDLSQRLRGNLDALAAKADQDFTGLRSATLERAARLQGSDVEVEDARRSGRISATQADSLRAIGRQAVARREAYLARAVEGVPQVVLSSEKLQDAGLTDLEGRPNAEGLAVSEAAEQEIRDKVTDWINSSAAAIPDADRLEEAYDAARRRIRDEVLSQFRTLSVEQLRARAGLSPRKTVEQVSEAVLDPTPGLQVLAATRAGEKAVYPINLRQPDLVPDAAYSAYDKVRRGDLRANPGAAILLGQALDAESDEARGEIVKLGLLRAEHLLTGGRQSVFAPVAVRREAGAALAVELAKGGSANDDRVERLRRELSSVEVDVSSLVVNPWVTPLFGSKAEVRAFGEGPDLPRLLDRLGLDESQAGDFLGQQLALLPQ